jgi:two-component system alkaline phosphatase synthesis response regulator PhoP
MSIKVLWVDDEPESLRYEIKLAEEMGGWQITLAQTVTDAVELLRDIVFDLIIVDLMLPLNSFDQLSGLVSLDAGIRFITSVRDTDRPGSTTSTVPLIIISAEVFSEQRAKVIERLVSSEYYLTKPLLEKDYRKIVKQITKAIEKSSHK